MKKLVLLSIVTCVTCCLVITTTCRNKGKNTDMTQTRQENNTLEFESSENNIPNDKIAYYDLDYDEVNQTLTLLDLKSNKEVQEVQVKDTEVIDAYQTTSNGYAVIKSTFEQAVDDVRETNGIVIGSGSSDEKTSYDYILYDDTLKEMKVIDLKSMISDEIMADIQESQSVPIIDTLGQNIAWSTINGIYVLNITSGEQMIHELEDDGFSWYEIAFVGENKIGFYRETGETTVTTRYGYWDLSKDQLFYEEEINYSPSQIRVSGNCIVLNDGENPATHSSSGKVVIYDCKRNQSLVFPVDNTESTFATVTSDGDYLITYVCLDNELKGHRVRIYQLSSKECINDIPFSTKNGVNFYDFYHSEEDYLLIGNGDSGQVIYHVFAAK